MINARNTTDHPLFKTGWLGLLPYMLAAILSVKLMS